jgi:membrane peptidoglycan carboxypeptidase
MAMENLWSWARPKLFPTAVFLFGGGFVLFAAAFSYAYFTVKVPNINSFVTTQSTVIQYADGSEIGRLGAQNRTIVSLANVPLKVREAVLSAEDRNFYTESAVSPTGIARALFRDLTGGTFQGGSTITQQYAKTAFLTQSRTITRKIKEIVISMKLEKTMSKDQIFENYLNTIYFGRGSYGVETAAEVYFGRTVDQLNVCQAAVLAAILNSPGFYDPAYGQANATRLHNRWAYVLDGMVKSGWLDASTRARLTFPTIKPLVSFGSLGGPKGYVVSWVVNQLTAMGYSLEQLQTEGFVIRTTLVKKDQEAAMDAVDKNIPAHAPKDLHIGLVSIRPGTGEILAMYGGQDYLTTQLNSATQSIAQGGSSFKPFALVAGLEQGIPLTSLWNGGTPKVFNDGLNRPYIVSNYNNESFGNIDLIKATANSVNTIFVPLGMKVGPDKVVDVARRAGIPSSVAIDAVPSVVLGAASPHVVDLAAAYATFAANGTYAKPFIISSVTDPNQKVLYQAQVQTTQAFAPDVMSDLTYALQAVTKYGTAAGSLGNMGRPTAGKTGTTTNNAAAWFNGYTPQIETTVGIFRDNASQSLNGIGGLNSVTGGTYPAMIWAKYTRAALAGVPALPFPMPAHIGGSDPVSYVNSVPTYILNDPKATTLDGATEIPAVAPAVSGGSSGSGNGN